MRRVCFLLILNLFLVSCGNEEVSYNEYLAFFQNENNGLFIVEEVRGVEFTCKFETAEKKALEELDYVANIETFNKRVRSYEGATYFRLDVKGLPTKIREKKYSKGSQWYSYNDYCSLFFKDSFTLDTGYEILKCTGYIFIPGDYISPIDSYLLVFPKSDTDEVRYLKLNFKNDVYGKEVLEFKFKKKNIRKIPQIAQI